MKQLITLLVVALSLNALTVAGQAPTPPPDYYDDMMRTGFGFWENKGQVQDTDGNLREDIQYVTEGAEPRAYIRKEATISFVMARVDTSIATLDTMLRVDMQLIGEAAMLPDAMSLDQKDPIKNYYLPHCGPNGVEEVHGFNRIFYDDVYPNIDMWMYSGQRGQKLMHVVNPGGAPDNIMMQFSGHDQIDIDLAGNLLILIEGEYIVLPEAVAYQYDQNNVITPVNWTAAYSNQNGSPIVTLDFDTYDTSKPLVFLIGPPPMTGEPSVYTPGVCWSTYYGGDEEDQIFASDIKQGEGLFVGGVSYSTTTTFPIEDGIVFYAASPAATIARFDDGDALMWSNYFGCSYGAQMVRGVAVKQSPTGSKVYVGGWTSWNDLFPASPQPSGWYVDDVGGGGQQGFLAAFYTTNGQLYWSTYFGGDGSTVTNVDFDDSGNLLVCGMNSGDLPAPTLTPPTNAEDWNHTLGFDGYVAMLDATQMQVRWSTYLGGTGYDEVYSVRCAPGKIVIAGFTTSPSIQTLSAGGASAHNHSSSTYSATGDLFLYEFTALGDQVYGSYFTYGGYLGWQGLALNETNGDAVLVGHFTQNQTTMPVSTTAPWYQTATISTQQKGFIWRLAANHVVAYSTFVGAGNGHVWLDAVAIRDDGVIFAGGVSWASNLSTQAAPGLYSANQVQGDGDAVLLSITPSNSRVWCTYFGGNEDEDGIVERVMTLSPTAQRLYATGYTRSNYDSQNNLFFPLNDEGNGAWWDGTMDSASDIDAFMAAFCTTDLLTGMGESEGRGGGHWSVFASQNGGFLLFGLEGHHRIELFDGVGRLVAQNSVFAQPQGTQLTSSSHLTPGSYLLKVDGRTSRKVVVH